jgi:hypothetical protein
MEEVQQWDSQDFTVRDEMTRNFLPVSNEICAIYIDDDVTKIQTSKRPSHESYIPCIQQKVCPAKNIIRTCIQSSQQRVPFILVLFFPFGDKMWGVAIMRDFTV